MTKLEQLLANAREIPVTDEEHLLFATNRSVNAVTAVRQRIKEPLACDVMAYAFNTKTLFVVDWTEKC